VATIVVAHGAWSAGWSWRKMRPLLADRGHDLRTPTYTGLGERAHLASPSVDLETHIADVLGVIETEGLEQIVLVGHSYGGVVATGVADRMAERVAQLIYLDAFVPRDGECAFDLHTPDVRARFEASIERDGDGWKLPPNPLPPDTSPEDEQWIMTRRHSQPAECFRQKLRLEGRASALPTSYVYCTRVPPGDPFSRSAQHARDSGWRYVELDASHSPHITAPEALAEVLDDLITAA
jgi:pimeloyl-ACP methyl ester carboxylesterase